MKYILILGIFLIASRLLGQGQNPFYEDTITVLSDKCNQELKKAEIDFDNGTYVIELRKPIPFSDTQQKVLANHYSVNVVFKDGIMAPNHDCYNYHLKTLVKQKWRADIFKRSKFTADSLDKFGLGDQEARFKYEGDFLGFLKKKLSSNSKKTIRQIKDLKTLYIKVDISENGFTDNVRIINSLHCGEIELEILELAREEELWIPKKDNGQGIKTWIIYSIETNQF